jgi:hypothetical protein
LPTIGGRTVGIDRLRSKGHRDFFEVQINKLNQIESKEKYGVEVSNRFAPLKNMDTEVEINTIWKTIR